MIESDELHTPHRIVEEGMNKRGPRLRKRSFTKRRQLCKAERLVFRARGT